MDVDVKELAGKLSGKFIVLDGLDGSGKSTQREMLAGALTSAGVDVVSCRDPGGTEIGDRIRRVLLDFDLSAMDAACETMLFMASRAQLLAEVVKPALDRGNTVLCDRFVTSTCAYQGAAGYDPKRVIELAKLAIGDCWPDVTLIFDVKVEAGFKRIGRKAANAGKNRKAIGGQSTFFENQSDPVPDAMEARLKGFHRKVRRLFLAVHEYYPTPVITVDGEGDPQDVHGRVLECLSRVID